MSLYFVRPSKNLGQYHTYNYGLELSDHRSNTIRPWFHLQIQFWWWGEIRELPMRGMKVRGKPRVSTISVRSLQFQLSNNKKVWIKEHILNQTKSASAMPVNREMHQNFTPILWSPPPSTNFLSHDYTSWIQISCNTSARPAPYRWKPTFESPRVWRG